jgi:hypothetical protein
VAYGTEKRLRGQEVQISIVEDGTLSDAFTAIATFNDTMKLEKKEDGFLGETSNRYDQIFNGYDGSFEMQLSNQKWMSFQSVLKAKARRENPNLQINIVRVDFYANGDTPSRTYVDCSFGAEPTAIATRADFVKVTVDFSCSDIEDQQS